MKLHFIYIVGLILFFTPAFSQIEQPLRVEIELERGNQDYAAVPVGHHGVVMYTRTDEKLDRRNKSKWMFSGYDTTFRKTWRSGYIINESFYIRDKYYSNGYLYLLFGRYKRDDVVMAVLNVKTGEITSIQGETPRRFSISGFKVLHENVYLNGFTRNDAALIHVNLNTGEFSEIDLEFEGDAAFESIQVDSMNNQVNIVYTIDRKRDLYLNIKTFQGKNVVNDLVINPEGDDNLLTGKITTVSPEEKVIIGTYGVNSSASNGMYYARILNNSSFVIKYYNFTDFNRFFDFLPERNKDRISRKKERRESKGKELNMDYQLLVHDLINKDGQYILIAEAFYPTYRSESHPYTTVINGVPIMQTRYVTVFDGYLYTHAVVAGFDYEGNMLWDNSVEMGDVKSFELEPKLSVNVNFSEIILAYGTYEDIKTKVITGGMVLGEKEVVAIKTGNKNDVIQRSDISSINHWYDNYFLVYGFQKIKNEKEEASDKKNRAVFYFNKISYN